MCAQSWWCLQNQAGPPGQPHMEGAFAEALPAGREVQLPTAAKPHSAICKYFHSPKVFITSPLTHNNLQYSTSGTVMQFSRYCAAIILYKDAQTLSEAMPVPDPCIRLGAFGNH